MRSAFRKNGLVYLKDMTPRFLRQDEIRVRVTACGICGTDIMTPDVSAEEKPLTGHEIAGTILETGQAVSGLAVGQKIVLDSATPCGRCDNCRDTRQELCTNIQSFFINGTFGFADEMIAPSISAIPCADLLPEIACLQEPLGVALDLVRLAEIQPGSNMLILGQGPIGLMATALARHAGAGRIFVTDFRERTGRTALAGKFGADVFLDPRETKLEEYDFGCSVERILVTAPPGALPAAFAVASKGAIISFIGIGHGQERMCTFDADAFHFKKLQLRASFASPALYGPKALRCLREGMVDGPALVTHRFPLERIANALTAARTDPAAVKVVVKPELKQ